MDTMFNITEYLHYFHWRLHSSMFRTNTKKPPNCTIQNVEFFLLFANYFDFAYNCVSNFIIKFLYEKREQPGTKNKLKELIKYAKIKECFVNRLLYCPPAHVYGDDNYIPWLLEIVVLHIGIDNIKDIDTKNYISMYLKKDIQSVQEKSLDSI